jgi:hypothetical protein
LDHHNFLTRKTINLKSFWMKDMSLADLEQSLQQRHHYPGGRN